MADTENTGTAAEAAAEAAPKRRCRPAGGEGGCPRPRRRNRPSLRRRPDRPTRRPRRTCRCPAYLQALQSALPGAVVQLSTGSATGPPSSPAARLVDVARHLRDTEGAAFDYCSDVTAVDWPTRAEARFDVVYCLYSTRLRHRVRLKARVADGEPVRR